MKITKNRSILLIVAGIIILLLSIFINELGFGWHKEGFGAFQITGTLVGAASIIYGAVKAFNK